MNSTPIRQRGAFTSDTLRLMRNLVDSWSKTAFMVQAAREICEMANARNFDDESWAIWQWIRKAIQYRLDPIDTQWIQNPYETMTVTRAGNCANMAIVAGTLLLSLGHPITLSAIQWQGAEDFSHAVVLDKLTGKIIDPVNSKYDVLDRETSAILEA